MGKYLDLSNILSKNRTWNIIEGERSIGKTYTTQKELLKYCIKKNVELVYICRTVNEKEDKILIEAFEKVIKNEFKDYDFYYEIDRFGIVEKVNDKENKRVLARCLALSEASKIKRKSYPNVKWIIFDEVQLETSFTTRYINGYKEPDLLISIYHTIDREEERVRVVMLTNNISFVNPYYVHDFFKIPKIEQNKIYMNDYLLYARAISSDDLKKSRENNKFIANIKDLDYNKYITGEYIEDTDTFIYTGKSNLTLMFNIVIENSYYGVYFVHNDNILLVRDTYDSSHTSYALDTSSHNEKTKIPLKKDSDIAYLNKMLRKGLIRYSNQLVKKSCENLLYKLL